ncbi:hypothetical protein DLAC_10391 [Tieghemostelium lacteum]|uniref:Uncharacterized protein n=1 Tax=Tieghemostelium lacteum TaxID=361077 RepID=A0A151Z596_TIELA|nr:hypothetical protein DLAC_10391 [Tieghemostelium lacteum]|eukprot:KYQ89149.1 hypothetical protein DLAC_10391 [Tieghemostelium lacteum]
MDVIDVPLSSSDSQNSNSHGYVEKMYCFQGLFNVQYQIEEDDQRHQTNISGIWTNNSYFVNRYLSQFPIQSNQTCFYNIYDPSQVVWIRMPSSIIFVMVICLVSIITLSTLLLFIYFLRKAYHFNDPFEQEKKLAEALEEQVLLLSGHNHLYGNYNDYQLNGAGGSV